jgi:hypothetical protein
MPAHDRISSLAAQRMLRTGEPPAHALHDLQAHPRRLLPAISDERAAFDARVLQELVRAGGFYWAHPFGVKGVWHEPGKTVAAGRPRSSGVPDPRATSRLHDDRPTCNHVVALNAGT